MQLAVGSWWIYRIFVYMCRIFGEMRGFENVRTSVGANPKLVSNVGHGANEYAK